MLLFRIQRCRTVSWSTSWPEQEPAASGMGNTKDLDDPDRAVVDMSVAARHSDIPGMMLETEPQDSCHFNSVTADVLKLKKPSWARHDEQKTLRLLG